MFHIALYQPEIPQNTGNIVRISVGVGAEVHLIPPLGFSLEDRYLKRAGLDYWQHAKVTVEESLESLLERFSAERTFFFSKFATRSYWDVSYADGDLFVFGRESTGLPAEIHQHHADQLLKIPLEGPIRSHNLGNAAAIVVYEAMRQLR
jgi:tRNA (cytidine/uridine-2'-O-)-methyltransferase